MKKLYVGNLDYGVTNETLADLFAQVGPVISAVVITDRDSGRSKGFGFVEMEDQDAEQAIQKLHGTEFKERELTVNEARPKTENRNRGGFQRGGDRRGGGGRGGYRGGGGGRRY